MAPALLAQKKVDLIDNVGILLNSKYEEGHERQYDDWGSADYVSLRYRVVLSVLLPFSAACNPFFCAVVFWADAALCCKFIRAGNVC